MTTNGHRHTQKNEAFVVLVFKTNEATKSYMTIYNCKSERGAAASASKLLTKPNIQARLTELRQKAVDESIGTVQERQQRLTEIYRAKLTDFMTLGADGSWIDVGPENPHAGAIQEITSKTEYDKDGSNPAVITKVKLHDPVKAIAEQNKMDKVYDTGTVVNVDNRKVEITVVSKEAQRLLDEVITGEGTSKEEPDETRDNKRAHSQS